MSGVIDRIRKLLALADQESGATDAERDNAAERAQRLITEHQITAEQLARESGQQRNVEIKSYLFGLVKMDDANRWVVNLLSEIATLNGAEALFSNADVDSGRPARVWLVGEKETCDYVSMLARWLEPQIRAETIAALEKEFTYRFAVDRADVTQDDVVRFANGFVFGAIDRVGLRLKSVRDQVAPGMALELSTRAAINDFYGDDRPTPDVHQVHTDPYGEVAGSFAGDRLDINPNNKVAATAAPALTQGTDRP